MAIRLTESRLRRIVREEIERSLDEMAFAGSLGAVDGTDFGGEPADAKQQLAVKKYTQSGSWLKKASAYYKNIPFNVWIATVAGIAGGGSAFEEVGINVDDSDDWAGRAMIMPIEDGKEALITVGYDPALVNQVGSNDLIILISNINMFQGALPSPWMVMHAIFDSQASGGGSDIAYKLAPTFRLVQKKCLVATKFKALTMASARDGTLPESSTEDVSSEIMCQELITGRGFHYNQDATGETIPELEELRALVKRAGDEFRKNARGKMICARV